MSDLPPAQARAMWAAACVEAGCPERVGAQGLGLAEAVGRVTAEAVWATRSSPAFDAAAMDGIAVSTTAGTADTVPAGPVTFAATAFDPVDTGDPLPPGRDAVVKREDVTHLPDGSAQVSAPPRPWQHVRSVGEDIAAGELLLPVGHRLRPVDVAAAAAAGATSLVVRRRPRVAVLPTGDEIVPVGVEPGPGQIPDTNSLMLAALAREGGAEATVGGVLPDNPAVIGRALRHAAAASDLVLVLAGSSAGRDDHTAAVIAEQGVVAVHGVAVRPGHPVVLGVVGTTPVIGVPGYPVSAALAFELFAAPLLASLAGTAPVARARVRARIAYPVTSPVGTEDWVRVRLDAVDGALVATPLARGAGVLTSLVRADALLAVSAELSGHGAGERVEVELLRPLDQVARTVVAVGSHDLALELLAAALRDADPHITLVTSHVGSLAGLEALRDGLCHLAGAHLMDEASGEHTLPHVARLLAGRDMAVVRLVHREQGLLVAPGNPLGLTGVADLARPGLRLVNRQPGSGTRLLLDRELRRAAIDPASIPGYARQETSHLAVAAAVATGRADCGLGLVAAARAFGLDVIPIAEEPYDLVLDAALLDSDLLAPLWAQLASQSFRDGVEALGGYSSRETGRRLR